MSRNYFSIIFYILLTYFSYLLLKDGIGEGFFKRYLSWTADFILRDKIIHVFIFSVLMFFRSLANPKNPRKNALLLFLYGILIEILQGTITETRSFDIYDIIADAIGIWIGFEISKLKIVNKILKVAN